MAHHEYLTLPFNLAVATIAGTYSHFVDEEDVWSFSPFVDLSLYRWIRRALRTPQLDRQILLLCLIMVMQVGRSWIAELYPGRLFTVDSHAWLVKLATYAAAAMVVGIPLKIWNALRLERKLEEQEKLLLEARMDALQRQIHPHFLFNTLNSIAALARSHPDMAREMTVKLANILRVLLREREPFVPLREELTFTDDYLDIEVIRFRREAAGGQRPRPGDARLSHSQHGAAASDRKQHQAWPGAAHQRRDDYGSRSRQQDRLQLEVEDDGVGMRTDVESSAPSRGHRHRSKKCSRAPGRALRRCRAYRSGESAGSRNPRGDGNAAHCTGDPGPRGLSRARQHLVVVLLIQRNDPGAAEAVLRRAACPLAHLAQLGAIAQKLQRSV